MQLIYSPCLKHTRGVFRFDSFCFVYTCDSLKLAFHWRAFFCSNLTTTPYLTPSKLRFQDSLSTRQPRKRTPYPVAVFLTSYESYTNAIWQFRNCSRTDKQNRQR